MPVVKPTVPKADVDSKSRFINFQELSVIVSMIAVEKTIAKPIKNIDTALLIVSNGNLLVKQLTSSSPFTTDIVVRSRQANVVVLIPPAVDPGDPPINISIIVENMVVSLILDISTE